MAEQKPFRKILFNEHGDRDYSKRRIFGGNSTNLLELTNLKYEWADPLYKLMMANFWIPEEISLIQDAKEYQQLTEAEREAFDKIICFLVFLDSIQTFNLPEINDYVTAPEINGLLTIHAFQEFVHSKSYAYILESVVPAEKRQPIYDLWRVDPVLYRRNKYIADIYQEFVDNKNDRGFVKSCMANFILEGIYFYSGFAFFYNLARRGKMTGVATEIRYINRDENTHLALFRNMMFELRKENPHIFTPEFEEELRELVRGGVEQEIEWGKHVIGDKIEGLSSELIEQFIKYLGNNRLKMLKFEPLWPEVTHNPLTWFDQFQQFDNIKTDFFEEKVTNYTKSSSLDFDALE